jgi:serpin B
MLHVGARGSTADEIAEVFHFDSQLDEIDLAIREIFKLSESENNSSKFNLASKLWAQSGLVIDPEFKRIIGGLYKAEIEQLDFVKTPDLAVATINEWTAENTNRAIEEIISPEDIEDTTKLILTNAVYFKAAWEKKFLPELTRKSPFYLSEKYQIVAPMMSQTSTFRYSEMWETQVLEMPYASNALSMVIFLPTSKGSLSQLEDLLMDEYCSFLAALRPQEIFVSIPKFQFGKALNLRPIMERLGLIAPFQPYLADFSGLTKHQSIYIKKARHKAFIDVTEEGTVAAATTDLIPDDWGEQPEVMEFVANRPFLFVIQQRATGAILFLGRVVNPLPNSLPEERKSKESTDDYLTDLLEVTLPVDWLE